MYLIDGLLNKVRAFNGKLEDGTYMMDIVKRCEADICEMNSQQQLYDRGVDNLGVGISTYMPYAPLTISIKTAKGQPTDRVTLRDEGDFYAAFSLRIDNEAFEITSDDWKTDKLVSRYGAQIFGLTNDNASALAHDYIYPDLLEIARTELLNG